jgi:hypothetical protein
MMIYHDLPNFIYYKWFYDDLPHFTYCTWWLSMGFPNMVYSWLPWRTHGLESTKSSGIQFWNSAG